MADELFEQVPRLQVIICRQCRYGVWPAEVETHLKKQHQLDHTTVAPIVKTVSGWRGIATQRQAVQIPHVLDKPLPVIPCYATGLVPRLNSTQRTVHFLAR
ncbi:hypothetical protein BDV59DRAFT_206691 [Aspergillus ambiguus]|uniref:uncharacterized protein n=1 Tax=Aspergillus ambiguus TaxID=176160 RepID=UPI003CCE0BD6